MVSLVPVRKRRRLGNNTNSCAHLGEGTYGKKSLWENLWRACGCSCTHDPGGKCSDCQGVYKWLCRFVSREALRISRNNILQIKGNNTPRLVYIDDKPVTVDDVSREQKANNTTNSSNWMGCIQLKVGNKLSLKFASHFPDNPMDFEVIDDTNEQNLDGSESMTQKSTGGQHDGLHRKQVPLARKECQQDLQEPKESSVLHGGKIPVVRQECQQVLQEPEESSFAQCINANGISSSSIREEGKEEGLTWEPKSKIAQSSKVLGVDEDVAEDLSIESSSRPASQPEITPMLRWSNNEVNTAPASARMEDAAVIDQSDAVPQDCTHELQCTPKKSSISGLSLNLNTPDLEDLFMCRLEQQIEAAAREDLDKCHKRKHSFDAATIQESSDPTESAETLVVSNRTSSANLTHSTTISENVKTQLSTVVKKRKSKPIPVAKKSTPKLLDLTQDDFISNSQHKKAHIFSSQCKESAAIVNNDKSQSIMFVKLGRELTSGRIRTLANVAKRKGAIVATKLESNPKYLVIDECVNVETLCRHLGFNNKMAKLKRSIVERNITPVKPSWITNNQGETLKAPKLFELYNGLIETRSPKQRRPAPAPARPNIDQSDDDDHNGVSEVPANGGPVIRNVEISKVLEKLGRLYNTAPIIPIDEMRAYTFNLVAGRLRLLDFDIKTYPQALETLRNTRGIGASCIDVIKEWMKTGRVERIRSLETDPARVAFRNMNAIWGVGPTTAQRLVRKDFCSIIDVRKALRSKKLVLNDNQMIGVECYEDFKMKMPRHEVEQIRDIVAKELHKILPNAHIELMGSYRRGKTECGDGDLFITDPGFVNCTPRLALGELVRKLQEQGHIAYNLTQITGLEAEDPLSSSDSQSVSLPGQPNTYEQYFSSQSYMGVFNSPAVQGKRRRVDIKFYPYRERAFASIYFTGCGWFNRSMRLWATRKKKVQLNDHGIFLMDKRMHHIPRPGDKLLLEATTEVEIFDYLGLVYKQPHERNCFDDVVSTDGATVASLNVDAQKAFREEQRQGHDFRDEEED